MAGVRRNDAWLAVAARANPAKTAPWIGGLWQEWRGSRTKDCVVRMPYWTLPPWSRPGSRLGKKLNDGRRFRERVERQHVCLDPGFRRGDGSTARTDQLHYAIFIMPFSLCHSNINSMERMAPNKGVENG